MTANARGSLAGFKVPGLTEYMAGPYYRLALADMSAEVSKIERQGRGKGGRSFSSWSSRRDILAENNRATVMERAGFDYDTLSAINPRPIYASLSDVGSDGPYREKGGFDPIAQAMVGLCT